MLGSDKMIVVRELLVRRAMKKVYVLIGNYGSGKTELALNFAIELLGADRLSEILLGNTFFQPLIAALIGLIPNCAASVLLTEMYLGGALSFASVIAGLCSGAGIGLMVLFRTNKKPRENLKILGLLYGISAFSGVIIEIFTKLMA